MSECGSADAVRAADGWIAVRVFADVIYRQAIADEAGSEQYWTQCNRTLSEPDQLHSVCMIDVLLAVINPGDEVIVFEPFYENYGPDAIISGATPRYVQLRRPDWSFDEKELAAAFNDKTKAIIINTPNNPTGKVFSREELKTIADLCQKWDVLAITDEIYEHIIYDGTVHARTFPDV